MENLWSSLRSGVSYRQRYATHAKTETLIPLEIEMKKSNVKLLLNALLAAAALGALPMAEANVINLGFEQGFAAWDIFRPSGAPNGVVFYDTPSSLSVVNPPNLPITIQPYYGSRFAQITSPDG